MQTTEDQTIKAVFNQILFSLKTLEGHFDALTTENTMLDVETKQEQTNVSTDTQLIVSLFPYVLEKVLNNQVPSKESIKKTLSLCKDIINNLH
jgi:hypothetical protein